MRIGVVAKSRLIASFCRCVGVCVYESRLISSIYC